MIHSNVISAVFRRNFKSYFASATGYVFISIFIAVSAFFNFVWEDQFFTDNLANLQPLNEMMPLLLLFFIPAVTMNLWADEKKQGTDELLLTLPAHDLDIVLGKYFAALGIYTVALAFSLTNVGVLSLLGSPDLGLIFCNYVGYYLMGALLLSAGMVGSMLSSNATIGFIMGALICSVLVLPEFGPMAAFSVGHQFSGFGAGLIDIPALLYFVALTLVLIYVNVVLLGRRHWFGGHDGSGMWYHFLLRTLAVVVIALSINVLAARSAPRLDATQEQLHSLSPSTTAIIDAIDPSKPVFIHAWISPEVPREWVTTRTNLLNLLREFDDVGGNQIRVQIRETEKYSDDAREAEEVYSIQSRELLSSASGRFESMDVYLGLAIVQGPNQQVIPFLDKGLPVEYELARSVRVVSQKEKKVVGVIDNDLKLFGGFDFASRSSSPEWAIVKELKKQYDVRSVSPDNDYPEELDTLVVILPSLLTQEQMNRLDSWIGNGGATLLVEDPLPTWNPGSSPRLPAQAQNQNPFGPPQEAEPKGNLAALLRKIGVRLNPNSVIWDAYNPHPKYGQLQEEVLFIGPKNGTENAISANDEITSGLQEILMLIGGTLEPADAAGASLTFTPLLKTSPSGGLIGWDQLVVQDFFGTRLRRPQFRSQGSGGYTVAGRVTGTFAGTEAAPGAKANVIVISDADFLADTFFQLRRSGELDFDVDNVTFVLNCIDDLAGDRDFIALRKRRPEHRTLTALEEETRAHSDRQLGTEAEAKTDAEIKIAEAQRVLDDTIDELQNRTDIDGRQKEQMIAIKQQELNRSLEVTKQQIEEEKEQTIEESRAEMQREIRSIQGRVKVQAVLFPPIPVILIGLLVFIFRYQKEREGVSAARRL